MDPRFKTPKELAGPLYEQMVRSKVNALECLQAPDLNVRIAAILICESTWKCGTDRKVVETCHSIAKSDAEDAYRIIAVRRLAHALEASKAPEPSRSLANVIVQSTTSTELRVEAYWALRTIQFGIRDLDFGTFLKGVISTVKPILRAYPLHISEKSVKQNLLPQGRFPDGFWDSADDIDWELVRQFTVHNPKK